MSRGIFLLANFIPSDESLAKSLLASSMFFSKAVKDFCKGV
jgi:hypothetical protein